MADRMTSDGPPGRIAAGGRLAEVWGDVVNLRHLRFAVVIGPVVSLGAYGLAVRLLTRHGDGSQVDRAYAMLFGLAGCILACIVCSVLLPPKRVLREAGDAASDREVAIADLLARSEGKDHPVPSATVAELIDLGLHGLVPAADAARVAASTAGARAR